MEDNRIYRLEFNEKQQGFHLENNPNHPENHCGWFTIFQHCTDTEFRIFESYVNRIKKRKLTKKYLLKSADEIKVFMKNLIEWKIEIKQI